MAMVGQKVRNLMLEHLADEILVGIEHEMRRELDPKKQLDLMFEQC